MNKSTSINTRYPEDVLQGIKELAVLHERSFNGEVIWALRQYVEQQKGISTMTTTTVRTCVHVQPGQICPFEAQHQEYERRSEKLEQEQGQRLYDLNSERETLKAEAEYGIFCLICDHGNGCEHGVPIGRW